MEPRKGLGRGLSALLADVGPAPAEEAPRRIPADSSVPIERIRPNPAQPRRDFDERELEELTASIREKGVIQPLILRPHPVEPETWEIVAGERRWRAAQRAGIHNLPAVIRNLDDTEVLELAIIENIQRADLNPLEEAFGYRQLMDRFGHTQERLGEALGKSRSHIANLLRLLTLPEPVLDLLREGKLTAGHARALVTIPSPEPLARQIVEKGLSVRQAEALARAAASTTTPGASAQVQRHAAAKDADTRALEEDLTAALRLKVTIDHRPGSKSGELRIRYGTLEELDGLCQLLSQ
ncbi:ParB family chromosome partitioning protein [Amaricoccus macauensis]|uniref:ParB family chromosome partitioning protein n=1 Tax=Amaricoccus macauensis TaxID=57001 RepID=A0A840SQQ4_9RHOB|nr:ParB/RepB/Spo0J family partition protein [Amaricoccus macauensis]MBB5221572.1 ParB family chromosome partitioning protein [Amaricoccus macauensis]